MSNLISLWIESCRYFCPRGDRSPWMSWSWQWSAKQGCILAFAGGSTHLFRVRVRNAARSIGPRGKKIFPQQRGYRVVNHCRTTSRDFVLKASSRFHGVWFSAGDIFTQTIDFKILNTFFFFLQFFVRFFFLSIKLHDKGSPGVFFCQSSFMIRSVQAT